MSEHTPSDGGRADPDTVAVVGAGTMGRGIAQLVATRGLAVTLIDPFPETLERAMAGFRAALERRFEGGRLSEEPAEVLARVRVSTELGAASGAGVVIEAAPEVIELKRDLFRQLAELTPGSVLATNTSTLSVTSIATGCDRPERVVGLHFFNPAPVMRLVEVIPGLATDPDVTAAVLRFAERLGKTPVVAKDRPGFIVNRVARPFYLEAMRLAGEGVALEEIDRVMRGLGFRMGPFELLDLIGIDVNYAATVSVWEAFFHESRYRPHPLQRALVEAGRLGRKTGHGFYRYPRTPEPDGAAGGPNGPAEPAGSAPPALVLGEGPVADALRRRFGPLPDPEGAALVLDARVRLEEKGTPKTDLPIATLVWGHSTSLASARYGRPVAGFSLVEPLNEGSLVELYAPADGENDSVRAARDFFAAHGQAVVEPPDTPGGIGFRILALLMNEAASAVAEGLAAPRDIDTAMELGTNYPLGPLAWSLQLGLPTVSAALDGLHAELADPRYAPHPYLRRLAAVGAEEW